MINFNEYLQKKEIICEKHGNQLAYVFPNRESKCPRCEEELEKERELKAIERQKAKDAETRRLSIEYNFKKSLIPFRFKKNSFETYEAKTKEQIYNKKIMMDYATNFEVNLKDGISVILSGKVGNGKTHLACAVANYVIENLNKTALFLNVVDAFSKIKETYTKKSENSESDVLNQFCNIDLLILDEFGVQVGSEHEKLLLFRIINTRYENLMPTILISNLSALEIKNFEHRIYDRLKEGGFLLTFTGESMRRSKTIL